ncbi:hypothetical protein ACVGV8_03810, partial [Enterobacter intestinihominis]
TSLMLDVFTEESGRGGRVAQRPPYPPSKNKSADAPFNPHLVRIWGRGAVKNHRPPETLTLAAALYCINQNNPRQIKKKTNPPQKNK